MSSKSILAVVSVVAIFASTGCGGYMTRTQHESEMEAQKAYLEQLERRNAELEKTRIAYEKLAADYAIGRAEQEMYDQLAKDLTTLLKSMKFEGGGDMTYNRDTNSWTFGADLLFDSGSDTISKKGEETLKKFAETYKGQNVKFRIVGHTDSAPISKAPTKKANPTGMNIELGMNRSMAVAFLLKKNGIFESRMMIESQGNNQPVAPNDKKAENMKRNRRVEIFLVIENGKTPTKGPGK